MSFGDAVRTCYSKYATFQGRASRSEFWWFYLFTLLPSALLYLLLVVAGRSDNGLSAFGVILMVLAGVWALANILPFISVLVRRLHDSDRSGWWYWISLVPCIGSLWLLVLLILDGTAGPNRFGVSAA
jgi:uncharacterized membrane protein YhaH (DUF805 family)